mmetsp:Transcript_4093/g.4803  ORF Transcript_4093/g.4803 Transcript_4093/m.4803 type:complete len:152 (-) Transcript_4093:189-644(-)|eukprot:Skav223856  [mRNA]  locus=scaffold2304:480060:480515:- [translate_table: standard]
MPPQESSGMRSEGLLPAIGVGAAVYFTLSAISISTLGLVGIGAGVGYGVGSWAVDRYRQKRCEKQMDRLPEELKQGLQQWQAFLVSRLGSRQPTPAEAEAIFAEFAQLQPFYAQQVHNFVHAHGGSTTGGAAYTSGQGMSSGPRHVPVAEV